MSKASVDRGEALGGRPNLRIQPICRFGTTRTPIEGIGDVGMGAGPRLGPGGLEGTRAPNALELLWCQGALEILGGTDAPPPHPPKPGAQ